MWCHVDYVASHSKVEYWPYDVKIFFMFLSYNHLKYLSWSIVRSSQEVIYFNLSTLSYKLLGVDHLNCICCRDTS